MQELLEHKFYRRLFETFNQDAFAKNLKRTILEYPEENWDEVFSWGQIESKTWLLDKVNPAIFQNSKVFNCAGWFGTLPAFIFKQASPEYILNIDIDPKCEIISKAMNKSYVIANWRFRATTIDILDMQYPLTYTMKKANGDLVEVTDMPDVIINTSCEHIKDLDVWFNKIPKGTTIIMQSNNLEHEQHVNRCTSLDEFKEKHPMNLQFSGEKYIEKADYTRYMIIGIK